MQIKPDHRAGYLGRRVKAPGLYREKLPRRGIIGDGITDRAGRPGPGFGAQALRGLALHHNRDALHRQPAFKQPHQDRTRDVIGQVCAYRDRLIAEFLTQQRMQIHIEHIAPDDFDIVLPCQCFGQQRFQPTVQFDRNHLVRPGGKLLGQHTNAGADFQRAPAGAEAGGFSHTGANAGVDQEILAEPLGK